ncbi:MAG: hypothetical protein ABI882_10435, partial [Acidobacteriota bacterium]
MTLHRSVLSSARGIRRLLAVNPSDRKGQPQSEREADNQEQQKNEESQRVSPTALWPPLSKQNGLRIRQVPEINLHQCTGIVGLFKPPVIRR